MEQPQQRNKSMVFVLVGSAVFLAFATFTAMLLLTGRPSTSETVVATVGPEQVAVENSVMVNGVPIITNFDSSKRVILVSEINLPAGDAVPPTATPIPPTPGPTPTPIPPPEPTRDPNPVIFKPYTVVEGDSLYSIGETQNSSIELMAKHGIDADDLNPGTVIEQLPYANPAYCPGNRAYVVRDKDTVFRIANQFGTTVEAIAALNSLNAEYFIEVTQVICIPT